MYAMPIDIRWGTFWRGFAHWTMKPIPFPAMTFEPLEESPDDESGKEDAAYVVERNADAKNGPLPTHAAVPRRG